jgi:hypothetical protein
VQVRHTGIKARSSANEKREEKPRLTDLLLTNVQTVFSRSEMQPTILIAAAML